MHISQKAQDCGLSPIRKFHPYAVEAEKQGRKIYHLNIGQPDIETPKAYFEAVRRFADPVVAYAPSPGIPELVDAVRGYYSRRLGVELDGGDILITTGGSEALSILMNCILDEGDEVIVPEPYYPNYYTFIRAAGGVIRPLTTTPDEGYFYADRAKFEALLRPNTRALLVTNPGNPTGTILRPDELRMLAAFARDHGIYLVCDEVYREFLYDGEGELMSVLQNDGFEDNLVVIDSVSKRFSACGARIGSLISRNRELMNEALKFCQARLSVATLDQVAAAALYTVPDDYFTATRDEYRRRRDTVVRALRKIPGVVCAEPMGAFYLMAALPVDDADEFQKWLLTEFEDRGETVMYAPGASFYATPGKGRNEIRIAYVICEEDLARAVELLGLGIAAYNSRKK